MAKFNLHLVNNNLQDLIKSFYEDNPFTNDLGLVIDSIDNGTAVISLTIKHCHTNAYHISHGGVLMSLADTAMGAACLSLNKRVVTLDFNINMLKSVPEGDTIKAKTQVLHNGRKTVVIECSVFDKMNNLCCTSRATMFVLGQLQE